MSVAAVDQRVVRAPVSLCVLCGLPAAGKSTLAHRVLGAAAEFGWRAAVVPYDDLIPEQAFHTQIVEHGVEVEDMHSNWKSHRQAVLHSIEQFLQRPEVATKLQISSLINSTAWQQCTQAMLRPEDLKCDGTPLLFLLDDNFFYPSMRYEVYQLARKCCLGFCQVYLHCDLESCISRNSSRSKPVPTEVILEMEKRLEPPNPQKNSWEMQSISLDTADGVSKCDVQKVMELIFSALKNPLSQLEDNTEQKEADRLKCATSVVHQADRACRRLISETMKAARDNQAPSDRMRLMAAQLNEAKATFLHNLRQRFLQEAPFFQEEDIDAEQVAKRAVRSIFDDQRKDIASRFINNGE
ncbi:L-seryl-tRNA(Sec) kinase [Austrofundulus limnaeus]|uniref:L-seryl-tRNA(Sec) kinase n=1 Tax=Austrofundulus limnaeus TaxID=52670 RepID=A0A2I4B405_AUSLI|nr:PREDICTED: L-seryl-tRNA(Sec) kinase [Austrofundulus limnaeus]